MASQSEPERQRKKQFKFFRGVVGTQFQSVEPTKKKFGLFIPQWDLSGALSRNFLLLFLANDKQQKPKIPQRKYQNE